MENYSKPILTEEQMAAYWDGMLSTEESKMVEELIVSNPEMEEIQEAIDSIDSAYIYEFDCELPIECLADDFSLPSIRYEIEQTDGISNIENYTIREYDIDGDLHDEQDEWECQDEMSEIGNEESFPDSEYGEFIF